MDQRGKRLLIIAFIVILVFLGFSAYLLFFKKKLSSNETTPDTQQLVPFGDRIKDLVNLPKTDDLGNTQTPPEETDTFATPISSRERLRKITSFPVSGYTSFIVKEKKTETIIDEKTGKEQQKEVVYPTHYIRYNDQRNGHIFDGIITDESIINKKIIKTNLPVSHELVFDSTGTIGYLRYEKNNRPETFKLTLPTKNQTTLPQACTTLLTTDLKIKDRNNQVKILQDYMNYKFHQTLKLDGIFGVKTEGSVKTIQKMFSLPETGIVDQATREAISTECTQLQQEQSVGEPKDLKGSLVSEQFQHIVRNRTTNQWFGLERKSGETNGTLQSFSDQKTFPVFNSSFNEWLPQFVNKSLITMTTYASGTIDGYMYGMKPENSSFVKLLGPLPGLTTNTSPNGRWVFATYTVNNQFVSRIIDLETGTQQSVPFVTIPEKCTWYSDVEIYCGVPTEFPSGLYPDDWYKGSVVFSDILWKYNRETKERLQLGTFQSPTDIFRIESYNDLGYLFFINKNNNELWSYRVGGDD
jgi:hypothetical protein